MRRRSPKAPTPFDQDLDQALAACKRLGLGLDLRLKEQVIEIPYLALEDGLPTGQGTGTAAMGHLLGFADAHGLTLQLAPSSPQSMRFFEKLGFAWPEDDLICDETDLAMMRRYPRPDPSPAPAF